MGKIGEEFKINTYTIGNQSLPSITPLNNGRVVVVWQSEGQDGSGYGIYAQIFDQNGIPINQEFQVNTYNNFDQFSPSITALIDDNFIITWSSQFQVDEQQKIGGIYGQKFNYLGETVGNEFLIYASSVFQYYNENDRYIGSSLINNLDENTLLAIVSEYTNTYSKFGYIAKFSGQLLDESGKLIDDAFVFQDDYTGLTIKSSDTLDNDNIIIGSEHLFSAYSSKTIEVDIINNKESILDSVIRIDTFNNSNDTSESNYESNPSILSLGENFLVTWQSHQVAPYSEEYPSVYPYERLLNADIYGQIFSGNGIPISEQIQITNNFNMNEILPATTKLNENEILVVWVAENELGLNLGIYGQLLDQNGNLIGKEFTINSGTGFPISNLSITTLDNDNVMAVWEKSDNSSSDIYGQIFNIDDLINEVILDDPFYRFQNRDRPGTYLFAGEEERAKINQDFSPPFIEEGFAFNVSSEAQDGLVCFYRFQNTNISGTYLFASEEERVNIRENFPNFIEEGIAFYAHDANANQGIDIYRFQNTQQPGTYIFVAEEERNNILDNFPQFVLEGVAFEVSIYRLS